jgi:peptidoglycan/xylan/chitin deacetylase (PgdA/CDA1 family)
MQDSNITTRIALLLALFFISSNIMANNNIIRQFKTNEKIVFLTFDDGPEYPYTPKVLDVLDKYNVKATFFVLGGNAKTYPELIKRMLKDGHNIGNHSTSHAYLKQKSVSAIKQDIQRTDNILRSLNVPGPIPFRSPFGQTSNNIHIAVKQLNKYHVLFDFLPQDWKKISAKTIYNNVMKRLKPGLIITLHDGGKRRQQTVIATEMLIKDIRARGYKFKLVNDYLK